MEQKHVASDILHISVGEIHDWNCMKYYNQIQEILNARYDVRFTGGNIKVSSDSVNVVTMSIENDLDANMRELVRKIEGYVREGNL